MSIRSLTGPALAAALLGAVVATAQTAAAPVTDVGPAPAEERASAGAVVLEKSPVQAQKKAFADSAVRTNASSVGKGVVRATRAQMRAERASSRAAEAADLQRLGSGVLTVR